MGRWKRREPLVYEKATLKPYVGRNYWKNWTVERPDGHSEHYESKFWATRRMRVLNKHYRQAAKAAKQ